MIDAFYRNIKTNELKSVTGEVIENLKKGSTDELNKLIMQSDINIRIINISDFEDLYSGGDGAVSATHDIGDFEILRLYSSAKENGGEISRFYTYDKEKQQYFTPQGGKSKYNNSAEQYDPFEERDVTDSDIRHEIGVQFFSGRSAIFFRNRQYVDDFLYAKVEKMDGENEVMVISDVQVTPLDSTVVLLKTQLEVTTVVALIAALIVSFIVSKHISKPIEKLSKSALELARGNFNTRFSGTGYREIDELNDTLNYTASELAKVDSFRNEILANVSHDLRTPLTMIGGYAEVMRDIPGENTPENVQVIIDETKRLTAFVNDILDQSKLKSNIDQLKLENVNITALLEGIKERYENLTKQDGFDIRLVTDGEYFVKCDEKKISQAFFNLMDNAVNHTGDDKTVIIRQKAAGQFIRIEISDTGEGIPEDKLPYIWDRYYRVNAVHKRSVVGSGIGLSIVKAVFEAHKLKYGVESSETDGTTFWVEFTKI